MKKITYIFIVFFMLLSILSKSQVVINNGGIIYINGGTIAANKVFVVLNSPPATPISSTSSVAVQGIRMETEFSKLKYNLGTATTNITVPYLSWNNECFPLTMSSITAGTGATGAICFSSVPAGTTAGTRNAGWDNNTYKPTQVSNMYDISLANNSAHTIDRFWIIEPVYYTTRPAMTLDFTYITAEAAVNGSNIANLASTLMAQRFDTTVNQTWNGYGPSGTNATGATFGTVTGVTVASADFYPPWTLNDYLVQLPVQLLDIKGECISGHSTIKWTTASETNSKHFTVERSTEGIYYNEVAKIIAAGNSTSSRTYSFADNSSGDGNITYYRLSETDKNGKTEMLKTIAIEKCTGNIKNESGTIYSPDNHNVVVNFLSSTGQNLTITAFDLTGRLILQDQEYAVEGNNTFNITTDLTPGIYLFEITTNSGTIVKKIIIDNKN